MNKHRVAAVAMAALMTSMLLFSMAQGIAERYFVHHVIVSASEDISIWQEQACENALTDLDWGTASPGTTTEAQTVWVRNDGTAALNVTTTHDLLPDDIIVIGGDAIALDPGQVGFMEFYLSVGLLCVPGSYSFGTTLHGTVI